MTPHTVVPIDDQIAAAQLSAKSLESLARNKEFSGEARASFQRRLTAALAVLETLRWVKLVGLAPARGQPPVTEVGKG